MAPLNLPSPAPGSAGIVPDAVLGANRRDALLVSALIAPVFWFAYLPVMRILWQQWSTDATYSFGVLVPLISATLAWLRRERLRRAPIAPSLWWGGAIVFGAAGLLVIGRLSAIVAFQELSLVLMLVGLVTFVFGLAILRELWFPLAYLLLMLPVWEILTDPMRLPSQLFSATLAETLLKVVGVPVHREQVYLQLPNVTLEVASVCSGVSFLIAVIAVGVPQAYVYLRGWLPRAAVIGFAIAIAFLSNGLRVAIIGLLAYHRVSGSLHGPGHILQGLFVSSAGFVALLLGVNVLRRRYGRLPEPPVRVPSSSPAVRVSRWKTAGIAAAALLALTLSATLRPWLPVLVAGEAADSLPDVGSRWRLSASGVPARFIRGETEQIFSRAYEPASGGQRIDLTFAPLVYTDAASGIAYRTIELPSGTTAEEVALSTSDGTSVTVMRAIVSRNQRQTVVLFWYDLDGRATTRNAIAKMHVLRNFITSSRPSTRLILVAAERASGSAGSAVLDGFVIDVLRGLRHPTGAQRASAATVFLEPAPQ